MLGKLSVFADLLDEKGLKQEADEVDLVIKEAAPLFETPRSKPNTLVKTPGAWKAEQDALREKSEKKLAETMRSVSTNLAFKSAIEGNDFIAAKNVILTSLDQMIEEAKLDSVGISRQLLNAAEAIKRTINKIEEEGSETIVPTARVAWPEEDIVKLVTLINAKKGINEVAQELGKTPEEVRTSIEKIKVYEKLPGNKGKSIRDFIASQKPYNPACKKLQSYVMSSFMSHSGLGVFIPSRFEEPKSDVSRLDKSHSERYREEVDPRVQQRQEEIRKKYDASLEALMKLADTLDSKGLKAEADEIDNFIKEAKFFDDTEKIKKVGDRVWVEGDQFKVVRVISSSEEAIGEPRPEDVSPEDDIWYELVDLDGKKHIWPATQVG